jgi:hypothetical protein
VDIKFNLLKFMLKLCSDLYNTNFCVRVFGGVYFKSNHRNLVMLW